MKNTQGSPKKREKHPRILHRCFSRFLSCTDGTKSRNAPRITEVIIQSWKSATRNKHSAYQKQWIHFSSERNQDPLHPLLNHVLNILHSYQIRNLGYSVLNTIRSMLSSFVEIDVIEVGKYPIICRYMKGAYNMNPSLPKHNFTWNVRAVAKYLINASSEKLYDLSKKLATLTAIPCGQRPH